MHQHSTSVMERSAYPVKHWAQQYGVSERKLRNDIAAGKLHVLRFGRAIRITQSQFESYIAGLEG